MKFMILYTDPSLEQWMLLQNDEEDMDNKIVWFPTYHAAEEYIKEYGEAELGTDTTFMIVEEKIQ